MRGLVQPGPIDPIRIDVLSGALVVKGGALNPFRYVMPGPADDASLVAYFSAPHAPVGVTRFEQANAMFG